MSFPTDPAQGHAHAQPHVPAQPNPHPHAEVTARYRPAADVEQLNLTTGSSTRFVAPGSVTDREFGFFEWNLPPSGGDPDPHFHKTFSESFYVISGTIGFYNGERWISAQPGDFL